MACVLWDTMIDCDQLIDLKMCFEERTICAILNMNWKLLQHKRVINIVHSLNRLRTVSEQIDRNNLFPGKFSDKSFFKSSHDYLPGRVVTPYVCHTWKARG